MRNKHSWAKIAQRRWSQLDSVGTLDWFVYSENATHPATRTNISLDMCCLAKDAMRSLEIIQSRTFYAFLSSHSTLKAILFVYSQFSTSGKGFHPPKWAVSPPGCTKSTNDSYWRCCYCHDGFPQCNVGVAGMSQWCECIEGEKPCEDVSFGPLYNNAVWTRNDPREMCQLIRNEASVPEHRKTVQVWKVIPDHAFWGYLNNLYTI